MIYSNRSGALRWQKPDLLSHAIVMFILSLTFYKIFTNQIKCQKFDLEMKINVKEGEKQYLYRSTEDVRIHVCDFI